ncbi:MAG TPA: hypothetical protein VEA99_16740 [Gemmatimonadaceae bacterium]|nr:hypothetical protein [Gemmatimonadaceae bacterium]
MAEPDDPKWREWLAELDDDTIARALGGELVALPDAPMWRDERFLQWLRARAEGPADEHDAAERLEREGEAMRQRLRQRGLL